MPESDPQRDVERAQRDMEHDIDTLQERVEHLDDRVAKSRQDAERLRERTGAREPQERDGEDSVADAGRE
jgi:predicted  nucleic acid-binding Zn-ribbon protein